MWVLVVPVVVVAVVMGSAVAEAVVWRCQIDDVVRLVPQLGRRTIDDASRRRDQAQALELLDQQGKVPDLAEVAVHVGLSLLDGLRHYDRAGFVPVDWRSDRAVPTHPVRPLERRRPRVQVAEIVQVVVVVSINIVIVTLLGLLLQISGAALFIVPRVEHKVFVPVLVEYFHRREGLKEEGSGRPRVGMVVGW